jgi:hypothetical protein
MRRYTKVRTFRNFPGCEIAKADLILEVNESGGVTPSFSYTQPLANGFIFGLGPNSINAVTGAQTNVVSATAQNFTLGAAGTFNASATRAETLSFNLSMAELKDWKDTRQRLIDKGQEPTGIYSCDPSAPTDLQAGLDLNSWLDEALKPVELGDLQTGIHPTPSQSAPAAVSSPAPAAAGAGGAKTLEQKPFPNPTISPEQKAFLDLSLTTALTELEVPYDLNNKAYVDPRDPSKACTTASNQPGKSVTFRPPSYPSSNPNSLVQQSATNAQNAQSSAAEVFASQILDGHIKQKALQAAREARSQSLQVQKAAQYAAQRVLAVCEADTLYINPDKCISYAPATSGAAGDAKLATSSIDLTSSANPVPVKTSVRFTATVSALGANTEPGGSITFKEGDKSLGSDTLSHGVASLAVKFEDAGTHLITASYGSDGNFSSSVGSYTQEVVGTNTSTTTIITTPNPSDIGKQVTFIATVAGSGGTPTGTVTFKDDDIVLARVTLEGGRARYTTTSLAGGERSIVAEYSGDQAFGSSKSDTTQKVQGGSTATNVVLWSSANPSATGQLVTFTARVTGAKGNTMPTGSVLFIQTTKNGVIAPLGNSVLLKDGEATISTPSLAIVATLAVCFFTTTSFAAKKAFVVGINDYQSVPRLTHSVSDANKIAQQLSAFGYDTIVLTEPGQVTRTALLKSWQKLLNGLGQGDDVVFFYSGHGVEVQGTNYLVPIDTPNADDLGGEDILKQVLISLPALLSDLNKKPLNGIVWILDACRDNPFTTGGKSLGGSAGLANMEGPAGTFIFFSAGFGQTALDHLASDPPTEQNSIYTRTLLKLLPAHPYDPVTSLAIAVRPLVRDLAKPHDQRPAYYDGLDAPWCFVGCQVHDLETNFQTATAKINSPSTIQIAVAVGDQTKSLAPVANNNAPNAVFLGKLSAAETCAGRIGDNFPFGCDVLRDLLVDGSPEATAAQRKQLIGIPLTPQTYVNVRLHAPTVDANGAGIYSCVVETLTPKSTVTLSGILEIAYAGDSFLWGTIAGDAKKCKGS